MSYNPGGLGAVGPQGPAGLAGLVSTRLLLDDDTPALPTPYSHTHLSDDIAMPVQGLVAGGRSLTRDFTTRASAGVLDGTVTYVTSGGVGLVDVAAGEGFLRNLNDQQGDLVFIAWPAMTGIVIPAPAAGQETARFLGVEWNAGVPQVTVRTTFNWNWYTDFPLARVTFDPNNALHILNAYAHSEDTANLTRKYLRLVFPFQRETPPEGSGGLELGETGTRKITMSAGKLWHGFNNYSMVALDTNVAGTFDVHYRNGSGGFTYLTGTQWPNTQYDDGTGTLATLGANRFANLWWYLDVSDNSVNLVHGRAQFVTLAAALAEAAPATLPAHLQYHGRLIAQLTFQKNDAVAQSIRSAWAITFAAGGISDHNQLSNLQGGAANEYYHLTASEYAKLGGTFPYAILDRDDARDMAPWPLPAPSPFDGRLVFPLVANPATGVTTLDEYREGNWTPADASGAGLAFTNVNAAEYVKVGKLVICCFDIAVPVNANGANFTLGGLPFTSGAGFYSGSWSLITQPLIVGYPVYIIVNAGATTINCYDGALVIQTNAQFSGSRMMATVTYRAGT